MNQVCSCSPFSFCFCLFAIRYTVLPRASFYCCRFFFFSFFFFWNRFCYFWTRAPVCFQEVGFFYLFVCLIQSFCLFCRILCFFFCRDFSLFSLFSVIYSPFLLLLLFSFVVAVISRCFSLLHTVNEVISLIYAFSRISILVLFAFSACFFCDFFFIYIHTRLFLLLLSGFHFPLKERKVNK